MQRDQERLGHQLPGHLLRFGAERQPDRQLLLARFGAHEEEIGDIRARDEQDQGDRAEENPQHLADVADDIDVEWPDERAKPRLVEHLLGEALRQLEALRQRRQQALDVGVGLRDGDAGLEPREPSVIEPCRVNGLAIEFHRHDHERVGAQELEILGQHADHLAGGAIHRQALTDGRGTGAERALPVPDETPSRPSDRSAGRLPC